MKVATIKITIPEDTNDLPKMTINNIGVSNLDMVERIELLLQHFTEAVIKEAKDLGYNGDSELNKCVEFLKNKL